jgi:plasmid replication initiation protein
MNRAKQYSLFKGDESFWEIKKHSSLVQISNMASLVQRKSMNALVCVAKDSLKRTPEQRVFKCDLSVIKRLCGLGNNDNESLKEGLKTLKNLNIEYNVMNKDKSKQRGVFSFLSYAHIDEAGRGKASYLTFEFPSIILDVVKRPNMYVTLNLLVIRGLNSKHSIALYEFLKDYINLNSLSCSIEDFRKLMGIGEGQYEYSTMLRKRVLEVAVAEINEKTDIEVSYELEKQGRKLIGILFKMKLKNEQPIGVEGQEELKSKLAHFGVNSEQIQYLLDHHDEQYIWANISVVEEQAKKGTVKNITAYLLKAFEKDYRPQETEYDRQQKLILEEKQQEQAEAEETATKEKIVQKQFNKRKKEIILDRLGKLPQTEQQKQKTTFLEAMEQSRFFSEWLKRGGFEDGVIQTQRINYLSESLLSDNEKDFEYFSNEIYVEVKEIDFIK